MPALRPPRSPGRPRAKPVSPRAAQAVHDLTRRQLELRLTDLDLMTRAGYSVENLGYWRRAENPPTLTVLVDVAQAMGCEVRVVPIGSLEPDGG